MAQKGHMPYAVKAKLYFIYLESGTQDNRAPSWLLSIIQASPQLVISRACRRPICGHGHIEVGFSVGKC